MPSLCLVPNGLSCASRFLLLHKLSACLKSLQICHPRESGDPVLDNLCWIPAFARQSATKSVARNDNFKNVCFHTVCPFGNKIISSGCRDYRSIQDARPAARSGLVMGFGYALTTADFHCSSANFLSFHPSATVGDVFHVESVITLTIVPSLF